MSRQQKFLFEVVSPSGFYETQVRLLVRAVYFIADDWVPDRGQMHTNLVGPSRSRNRADDAESFA